MIIKFDTIEHDRALHADLCIIGAGASGIALTREFAGGQTDVIVLESGGLRVQHETESLNVGDVSGNPFVGLTNGRRRVLGGATSVWGGQCCELSEIDFEAREWVPYSGWPFGRTQLASYYRRAERVFGVAGERYDESNWRRFGIAPIPYDEHRLRTTFAVFCPRSRLARVYRTMLARSKNVRVILGATATHLGLSDNGARLSRVEARDASGRRASIFARAVVLCAGGIESARLLLSSRDVEPNGIGNRHDVVGRFFQDHPNCVTAEIAAPDFAKLQDLYTLLFRGRTWYWPKIALAPDLQRSARVLNAVAAPIFRFESPAIEILRDMVQATRIGGRYTLSPERLATLARGVGPVSHAAFRRVVLGRSPRCRPKRVVLQCFIEQAPNPESRITLSESRDALGVPYPHVRWKVTDLERETMRALTAAVAQEFRRLGLGSVVALPWLTDRAADWPSDFTDAYHHSGTTRMSPDPARGVVDVNCRVHGVQGLYVAGSPSFPTSGYANTMLTIVALTIRLADHLKQGLLRAGAM